MNLTYEQIQSALPNLDVVERRRLFTELVKLLVTITEGNGHVAAIAPDPALSNEAWLTANEERYRGQWVALKDGALLAHGAAGKAFVEAVKATGVSCPLLHFIPPAQDSPQVGSWDLILSS